MCNTLFVHIIFVTNCHCALTVEIKKIGAIFGLRILQCFVKGQGNGVFWILISMFLMEYVFKIHCIPYEPVIPFIYIAWL